MAKNKKMRLLNSEQIQEIFRRFREFSPEPKPELVAPNAFCLLVSVILSAQTTDKAVNRATLPLYEKISTPEEMIRLGEENLASYIKSIGLYRTKSKNVVAMSRILVEKFGSRVPDNRADLESLPGVGRKTAGVVLNVVYGKPTIPVDTHLFRICPRIGLAEGKNPQQVEESLLLRVPAEFLHHAHHWLILHGRYVCTARSPKCEKCIIADLCMKNLPGQSDSRAE